MSKKNSLVATGIVFIFSMPVMQYAMEKVVKDHTKEQKSRHAVSETDLIKVWDAFMELQKRVKSIVERQNTTQLLLIQLQKNVENLQKDCNNQTMKVKKQVARMAITIARIRAEQDKQDQGNAAIPTSPLALQSQVVSPRKKGTSTRDIESPEESNVATPRESKVISPRSAGEK